MNFDNFMFKTDSYKPTHWPMYHPDTEYVYSYFESRYGARFAETLWFGLQSILQGMAGAVVTQSDLDEAVALATIHFGDPELFNKDGWQHIIDVHGGRLPLEIRAVPEGSRIPVSNVLMTVVNTDPECYWLTNYVESYLTHVWYPSTVASLSADVRKTIDAYMAKTSDNPEAANFMLHDFGYRGATTDSAAAIGGAAHLVNFMGTDTMVAMLLALRDYDADPNTLAFSVPASEHSVMTARGREGEYDVLDQLLDEFPTGILSVVGDSYDIYAFTDAVIARKDRILARDGRFVERPDSTTPKHGSPESLMLWIVQRLWDGFGGTINSKGYKVLDDHVRVLWGDGIDPIGIEAILATLEINGFSAENVGTFGMGGGLLQKVNRDTQRFAFKSSAQYRNGQWYDVQKSPLDASKASKGGQLKLIRTEGGEYRTVRTEEPGDDLLETVFLNGEITRRQTFEEIRALASA